MRVADRFKTSPWVVWTTWPLWFVQAAHRALPMLRAEESLRHATEVQLGTGSFKNKADADRVKHRWESEARGPSPKTLKARDFERMMLGLGVRRTE